MPITPRDALFLNEPRVPFVDEGRPKPRLVSRRHPALMGPLRQLGHEARATSSGRRRLAAIVAADVAGYSRLMHCDEEATHAKLTALLADGVTPAIAEHGGRIVKNTGDGFLAEFPSAVEAVRAAVQFQTRIKELTIGDAEDRRIALRVGVNIGDVIVEPHDIFGDGVNIAARLEGIAEPFEDMGEQALKNIARPVRVTGSISPLTGRPRPLRRPRRQRHLRCPTNRPSQFCRSRT